MHPMGVRQGTAIALAFALLAAAPAAGAQAPRKPLDVRVFARVPSPGQPEPVAIGPDGNVYVGTNQLGKGDAAAAPSKIFVFDQDGRLRRDIVLRGQKLDEDHGIQGLAFDADGLLYALDRAHDPRVVVIDPATGRQDDYAHFRDVPPCTPPVRTTDCSATTANSEAIPDYGAFGPDGSLYVSDLEQALIWRVPPGGGRPEVWFTHSRLENIFGPNGVGFLADGRTLLLALSAQSPASGNPTLGGLFTIPVAPGGRPGEMRQLWESRPLDGPDGFAIARSGTIWLALAAANQVALISPRGAELARLPANPVANAMQEIPFDGPGSLAFLGERVLVSNHSFAAGNPRSWAILDVFAGEPGLPMHRPRLRPAPLPQTGRRCLAAGLRLRRGRLGPYRLGRRRSVPGPRVLTSCVRGGGRVVAVWSSRGRLRLVASTAPRHAARGVRTGSTFRAARRAFPGLRRVRAGVYGHRGSQTALGVRSGRVRFVALAERGLLRAPRLLRAYLRRARLQL
jgi:hypothetical protein